MKSATSLILLIFSYILYAQSPYTNIQIRNVSYGEVSIEINPKNTNQLVAGCNIDLVSYSTNGGLTWTNGTITNPTYGVWGDPVIVADTSGHFYYLHLAKNPALGWPYYLDRIVIQKSTNAGQSWSNPGSYMGHIPPKQQDKEWMAVDFTHGSRGNWLYSTWTQFDYYNSNNTNDSSQILFSRSTDGGNIWTTALRINKLAGNCKDGDYTVEGATPSVGPNGELYVAWAGPQGTNNFKIFFDKSTDGGNTWLANDIVVASQPGGWAYNIAGIDRSNGLPFTACDYSNGPYRGYVYINWTDSLAPGDHDVKFVRSTNGGLNWSTPLRVNNDGPGKEQFLTAMTVDQVTGHIYIIFYDRRNYSDNQTDVYMARSTNGGVSFTNERISASPFTPSSAVFFGDYIDVTAHNGKIRPIWQRNQSGTQSIWTAIIDFPVGITHQNTEIPENYALFQNYPNPFNPVTKIKFNISPLPGGVSRHEMSGQGGFVRLIVYDLLGREAATLVNELLQPGTYEINWDASNHPSGVYYYKLNVLNSDAAVIFSQIKRMVLVK
jgi:hypothetical protein